MDSRTTSQGCPQVQPARPSRIARRSARAVHRHMDDRWDEWNRYNRARRALLRARVARKNALTKIERLNADLAVQRAKAAEAEQVVLDLWPRVPAEQRGYFNDDLEATQKGEKPSPCGSDVGGCSSGDTASYSMEREAAE